ncbi:MAG: hypothetical protein HYZ75_15910 [Elusimicrobia bacterium]|nr:hypothetical protein [Elusimicrobiota bacterium]
MRLVLFVWKDGVVERFGRLADSLRRLGHQPVLGLHPRSRGKLTYRGRTIAREPLARLLDRHQPQCIVLWNGDLPQDDAVKAACRRRAIPVLHCEMAWFPQADTVYFDWKGVNGASSIRGMPLAPLDPREERELAAFLNRHHARLGVEPGRPGTSRSFILAPLQVESDSNILKHSPIKSMSRFVRTIRRMFPDEEIVVRPHPKARPPRFALPRGCSYADPTVGLHPLLSRAKAVAALNSTVILEALSHFKPVVAFGAGLFSGHGAVLEADRSTVPAMRAFIGAPVDLQRRRRTASLLYELIFRRTFYNSDLGNSAKVRAARFYRDLTQLSGVR